jgi:hypothetical protein
MEEHRDQIPQSNAMRLACRQLCWEIYPNVVDGVIEKGGVLGENGCCLNTFSPGARQDGSYFTSRFDSSP